MTQKEFVKKVAEEKRDLLQEFLRILKQKKIPFCIVGGLGVNAYTEPVVSLDLDAVIVAGRLKDLLAILRKKYRIRNFTNSINISSSYSDLRIQIQTDKRYQDFIQRARYKQVLGYKLPVAAIEDILQGKIWAAQDRTRRASKRQKDLADISRLIEAKKSLAFHVPVSLKKQLVY